MDYIIGQKPASRAGGPNAPAAATRPGPTAPAGLPPGPADAMIVDGDQRTFMQDVIETSRTMPVLVDFWATWCGPCKQLTPALERVTHAAGGRIKLVKIDIDKNKQLIAQLTQLGLPLQSVPTVAAFWQGQIADIFQGALPESEIKRFVEALLKLAGGSMPAADFLAEGRKAAGQLGVFEARLVADPNDLEARYDMATALNAGGRRAEAADALLDIFRRDRTWREDAARQQLLKFFEAWGFDDPATMAARRKLSALLFS